MKRKKVKAIFIGKNGSLKYEHNKEYTLWIESDYDDIVISLSTGENECYYSSMFAFLSNWDNIRLIN